MLTDTLWNVYNYYSVLYSPLLLDDLNAHKQTIEKELKDFIDICRWQDMNYWALKQSVTKYNKGLFKIIKKFRQYLNQKIDLSKSSTQLAKQLSSQKLANSNLTLSKKDLNQLVHTDELNDDKYFNKMKIICKKSLHLKCSKYNFNRSLAEFTAETYSVFFDLNQISQKLTVEYEKDKKENGAKFKKDIKNLLSQKLKYISDLMK